MSLPFYVNWSKGPDLPLFLAAGHLATWNRGTAGSFSAHFSIWFLQLNQCLFLSTLGRTGSLTRINAELIEK